MWSSAQDGHEMHFIYVYVCVMMAAICKSTRAR